MLFLSLALLLPNFFSKHLTSLALTKAAWDQFDPSLVSKLQDVNGVLQYTDSLAKEKGAFQDALNYANVLAEVVRKRFYHGYSHYSLKENWLASLAGVTVWNDLSAIVLPDDILKYPMAACSQQSIVMMECFKRKGIDYRKIGFDHHFALEANIHGQWYFFDTNMEPDFSVVPRSSFASLKRNNELYTIYKARLDSTGLEYGLANQFYGKVNQAPAPRASFFHSATKLLSRILWLFPLLLAFVNPLKKTAIEDENKSKKLSGFVKIGTQEIERSC